MSDKQINLLTSVITLAGAILNIVASSKARQHKDKRQHRKKNRK